MNAINATLTAWADRLLAPLQEWPLCTLLVLSAAAGVIMAVTFRYASNQRALRRVANRSRAQVLAIKLFKDDLRTMFSSLGRLLRYTLLRLLHSLPPMLVMLVPFVLLLAQLSLRYEYRPLAVGETAVVELQMAPHAWQEHQTAQIDYADEQIGVETEPLRDAAEKAVYWRIRAKQVRGKQAVPGTIRWRLGSQLVEKQVAIAGDATRLSSVSPRRPGPRWWDRLLHPGEPGFSADSPVQAVVVHYAHRSTPVFGFDVVWWVTFLIASMLAALLIRPFVKVQF